MKKITKMNIPQELKYTKDHEWIRVEGKEAFERKAAAHGVKVLHYHADNGVFASQLWRAHCVSKGQGLSFAAVGAHHQNGRAEAKIRYLQAQGRTSLIHAAK